MRFVIFLLLNLVTVISMAQVLDSSIKRIEELPTKYISSIEKKISDVDQKLTRKTEKYLKVLEKNENALQAQLLKLDSQSSRLFIGTKEKYEQFSDKLRHSTARVKKITGGQYNSYIDTLATSLAFLRQYKNLAEKIEHPQNDLNTLQNKLEQSEKIREYLNERKLQVKTLLSKYTKLPKSLEKEYSRFSKTAYYYSAQLKEYKDLLKDPKKMEIKALGILRKLPVFQKFMKENSELASLFGIPGNEASTGNITGLQSRASVQGLIQQRVSIGGAAAQAQIQQNLSIAHNEINQLKDKVNKFGGSGQDIDMPDFQSKNDQKTKSFLKRIEFSTNMQFSKSTRFFPSGADIGLQLGYKLNNKSIIGIGAAYKMGIGNIQHFNISHQGIALRSFLDFKIKNQFFLSGGYERNHNSQFKRIVELRDYAFWTNSALFGISKRYSIGKKLKGEMKLLYDCLYQSHIPATQPIIYRLGYIL